MVSLSQIGCSEGVGRRWDSRRNVGRSKNSFFYFDFFKSFLGEEESQYRPVIITRMIIIGKSRPLQRPGGEALHHTLELSRGRGRGVAEEFGPRGLEVDTPTLRLS